MIHLWPAYVLRSTDFQSIFIFDRAEGDLAQVTHHLLFWAIFLYIPDFYGLAGRIWGMYDHSVDNRATIRAAATLTPSSLGREHQDANKAERELSKR